MCSMILSKRRHDLLGAPPETWIFDLEDLRRINAMLRLNEI